MSFGLTQYDMEELMTFTNNQCALMPLTGPLKLDRGRVRLDVLRSVRSWSGRDWGTIHTILRPGQRQQGEPAVLVAWVALSAVQKLKQADEREQGYVSSDELMNIPELSINPLARRLERLFDSINFKVQALVQDVFWTVLTTM